MMSVKLAAREALVEPKTEAWVYDEKLDKTEKFLSEYEHCKACREEVKMYAGTNIPINDPTCCCIHALEHTTKQLTSPVKGAIV